MIQDLQIVHRLKPSAFASTLPLPVWATCLRSLAFTDSSSSLTVPSSVAGSDDEIYSKENAYQFLLEVVCGLKSPIVGETEVFGQFKIFSREWVKREPKRAPLVQRILSDAKAIRSEYLLNLGTQSYGSWTRSKLTASRVHFLGGGQLVREIYPYLEKQQRELVVHLRDLQKGASFTAPTHSLTEAAFDHGALVIAAPMSAQEIENWLGQKTPSQVIDLRDNSDSDRITYTSPTKVHLLTDIFKEIEKTKQKLLPRLENVQREILARSARAATQSQLRPQGWDDLCA